MRIFHRLNLASRPAFFNRQLARRKDALLHVASIATHGEGDLSHENKRLGLDYSGIRRFGRHYLPATSNHVRKAFLTMSTLPDFLTATLEQRYPISETEKQALAGLRWEAREFSASSEVIPDRSRPAQSCALVEGMAGRCLWLASGDRQIASLHIPGDFVDLHGLFLKVMDHSVTALTECTVAFVRHSDLEDLSSALPRLGRLLFSFVAIDAAIQRNWILSLGQRSAEGRLADLLCELYTRYRAVGLATDFAFPFPITQTALADVLGLSLVHTNRIVKELRTAGLIEWKNGSVRIIDWAGLTARGEFDPVYLNLWPEQD